MKKLILLLATSLVMSSICSVYAQSFDEKPIAFLQKQLTTKATVTQLKKDVPKGYSFADETKENIIFEKNVGDKHYEITYALDEGQNVFLVTYQAHTNRTFSIMDEFEVLGYVKDESASGMLQKGIEIISYKNNKLRYTAMVTANDNTKVVFVVLSTKGFK